MIVVRDQVDALEPAWRSNRVVIVGALAVAPIRAVAGALSTSEPGPVAPGLMVAVVTTTAFMGALGRLGPVAMSARDVHWLLLSPLPWVAVLRRPTLRSAAFFLGTSAIAGLAALSVLGTRAGLPAATAEPVRTAGATIRRDRGSNTGERDGSRSVVWPTMSGGISYRWASISSAPSGHWSGHTAASVSWPRR